MNRVGVCEWCLPVWGPFSLDFAADCGYEGIQLTDLRGPYRGFPMANKCIQEGYKEASARTGVALASMHLMTLSHTTGHVQEFGSPKSELAKLSLLKGIEGCVAMGIPVMNLSGGNVGGIGGGLIKDAWENLIMFMNYAVRKCDEHGITVAYETCLDITYLSELLERVPGLTVNYDIENSNIVGTGFQIPLNIPEKIDHVHIKDGVVDKTTGKKRSVITGEGEGKIAEGVKLLKEKGFEGWYFSESKYIQYILPEDIVLHNYGSQDFDELSIHDVIPPHSFGLGGDLTEVCRKDCEAIKKLVL